MSVMDSAPIRLTQMVKKGGCAAKLPAATLRKTLKDLHLNRPEQLLVGSQSLDDAAVWDLGNGTWMVRRSPRPMVCPPIFSTASAFRRRSGQGITALRPVGAIRAGLGSHSMPV